MAKTFATFCDHFSDACSVTTTSGTGNSATDAINTATDENPFPPPDVTGGAGDKTTPGGQVTVTVTRGPATTTNAAPTARIGFAAGVLAVAGFAVMV